MAQEEFIDNLRLASRMLLPPRVSGGQSTRSDARLSSALRSADLWLTRKAVEGYDAADFSDWPKEERDKLTEEVKGFLEVADEVPPNKPAPLAKSRQARKHLEGAVAIVGPRLLREWLEVQNQMMNQATAAARAKGWYVEKDEKNMLESLLGSYKAPRLRIRTKNNEVVLDPIARFGSGQRGIVDLVVMPTYETAYLITYKDGAWQIVSPRGSLNSRPFTQTTLVNTITRLSHHYASS